MSRFLLLVPHDWSESQISGYIELLKANKEADYVDMRTWYRDQFYRAGTQTSWVLETVHGKQSDTREPHFNAFIVPPLIDLNVRDFAQYAITNKRPVYCNDLPVKGFEQTENNLFAVIT